MSHPTVLRDALLDPGLLDAIPGLAAALAGGLTVGAPDGSDWQQRERVERIQDETRAAQARTRLEEEQRIQESLRQAGYDAPVRGRTRPATPRVSD